MLSEMSKSCEDCVWCKQITPVAGTKTNDNFIFCTLKKRIVVKTHACDVKKLFDVTYEDKGASEDETLISTEEENYPNLSSLFEKAMSPAEKVISSVPKKKKEAEESQVWKPSSRLDKAFDFNEGTLAAALRMMFDVLKSMDERLHKIEVSIKASPPPQAKKSRFSFRRKEKKKKKR